MNQLIAQVEAPQPAESTTINPGLTQSQTEKAPAVPPPGVEKDGGLVIGTTAAYILLLIVAFAIFAFLPKLYKRSRFANRGQQNVSRDGLRKMPGTPRSQ